jgi:hypothetical protein
MRQRCEKGETVWKKEEREKKKEKKYKCPNACNR